VAEASNNPRPWLARHLEISVPPSPRFLDASLSLLACAPQGCAPGGESRGREDLRRAPITSSKSTGRLEVRLIGRRGECNRAD
jgi:hypothetical protein